MDDSAYWKQRALKAEGKAPRKSGAYVAKAAYSKRAAPKSADYYKYKQKAAAAKREATKEPGVISAIGSALGGMIGTELGPVGTAVGSFLGGKIGHLAEKITGFGDYSVKQNSIMRGGMTAPQIVNSVESGNVIVRFREYVRDIPATVNFTALEFPLNPGMPQSFPWLSKFAQNWDQYRWRGLIWEFGSTSSDAVLSSATSSALGTVNIATEYDVLDASYTSKREMLNTMFANSSKPSQSFIHPIECKRSLSPLNFQYVRSGAPPANADPRFYDLGKTIVATEGMQAASGQVGELWVVYEVEFSKQQITDASSMDLYSILAPTAGSWLGIGAANHILQSGSTLGGTINDAGSSYEFPAHITNGTYLFEYALFGSAATLGQVDPSVSQGTIQDLWPNAATTFIQSPGIGVSSVSIMAAFMVTVTGPGCIVTFGTAVIPTSGTGSLIVTAIADNLVVPT